jgi:hypothetical protein
LRIDFGNVAAQLGQDSRLPPRHPVFGVCDGIGEVRRVVIEMLRRRKVNTYRPRAALKRPVIKERHAIVADVVLVSSAPVRILVLVAAPLSSERRRAHRGLLSERAGLLSVFCGGRQVLLLYQRSRAVVADSDGQLVPRGRTKDLEAELLAATESSAQQAPEISIE